MTKLYTAEEWAAVRMQMEAERDAAILVRNGFSKIIKEQERLLRYVLQYSSLRDLLPDGWKEDCRRILADDFDAEAFADSGEGK